MLPAETRVHSSSGMMGGTKLSASPPQMFCRDSARHCQGGGSESSLTCRAPFGFENGVDVIVYPFAFAESVVTKVRLSPHPNSFHQTPGLLVADINGHDNSMQV